MRFWCQAKRISLSIVVALGIPAVTIAQAPVITTAYQQIRNAPFERTSLTILPQSIPAFPFVDLASQDLASESATLISPTVESAPPQAAGFLEGEIVTQTDIIDIESESPTRPKVKSAHVVVQPPMVQPYKNNQYSFVIENLGDIDANDVKIELGVNDDARIVAMLPIDAVVTDHTALLNIKKLHAGEHINIHLTATSKTKSPIKFSARLVHASEQEFGAATTAPDISVAPRQHIPTQADPYTVQALPVSTPHVDVPVIASTQKYQPRPHFQSNPHFQGQPHGKPLNDNPLHPRTPFQSVSSGGLTTSVGPVNQRPRANFGNQDFAPRQTSIRESFSSDALIELSDRDRTLSGDPTLTDSHSVIDETTQTVSPFEGPRNMQQNATEDFSINIDNPTPGNLKDVLVQLRIPAGMQIMTFDRETWYDEESKTVSFRIPNIESGGSESVHYQLKATEGGFLIQKLLIEAKGLATKTVRFDTLVRE